MNFFRAQDNFIQITKGAVSKRDCDTLIEIFENLNNDYDEEREYSACLMNILSPECISFRNALITSLEKYGKKYLFLKSTPDMQGISMEFNIQKYEPQKAYRGLHCEDWDPHETHAKRIMVELSGHILTLSQNQKQVICTFGRQDGLMLIEVYLQMKR